jgi:ribosomal protein L1
MDGLGAESIEKAIDDAGVRTRLKAKLLKGVFLGVSELDATELKENADSIASIISGLKGKEFKEQDVYELCLEERGV